MIAQSKVTIGTGYQEIGGKEKYFFNIDNSIYTVKIKDRADIFVQQIEQSSLKETKNKTHAKALVERAEVLNVFYSDKKFYIFTAAEVERDQFVFHGIVINQETFEVISNKKLTDVKGGIYKPYYQKLGEAFQSPDKSKFLVKYFKPLPSDKSTGISVGLYVFDKDLGTLGGKEMTMPFAPNVMDDMGYSVESDGAIVVAGYNSKSETYDLVKINPSDMSHKIVSTENKNFSYFNDFALNGDKTKYVAGFYENQGTTQMYFINLETSKSFEVNVPDAIVPYYKDKGKEKNSLMVHNAYVQEDGGLLVLAQELYGIAIQGSWTTTTSRYAPSSSSMIFNDFYMVRTNSDGTLRWIERIKKELSLTMSSFGDLNSPLLKLYKFYPRERYNVLSDNGKHYLLFEDDKKENKGKAVYICSIDDETGKTVVNYGFNYDTIDKTRIYHTNLKKMVPLGANEIGAEIYLKKEGDAMLRVKF